SPLLRSIRLDCNRSARYHTLRSKTFFYGVLTLAAFAWLSATNPLFACMPALLSLRFAYSLLILHAETTRERARELRRSRRFFLYYESPTVRQPGATYTPVLFHHIPYRALIERPCSQEDLSDYMPCRPRVSRYIWLGALVSACIPLLSICPVMLFIAKVIVNLSAGDIRKWTNEAASARLTYLLSRFQTELSRPEVVRYFRRCHHVPNPPQLPRC